MRSDPATNDRIKSAIAAVTVQGLLGCALIFGLATTMPGTVQEELKAFNVGTAPPPPVETVVQHAQHSKRREGAASPANLRAKPTEIVAPKPVVQLPPPPVAAAPKAGTGIDSSAGASNRPGPGTGSGGQGNGNGSGDAGDGDGDGGETPLRWISGRLKDSDYPRAAMDAGASGTVYLRFIVGVKGRVTDCAVTRSSGNATLDQTTCRLIKERFRYKPTLDAHRKAIPDVVTGEHLWTLTRREEEASQSE
ncbi:hypothetical protein BH09PSE4_BH09PSE4_22590 [soil metagenome]